MTNALKPIGYGKKILSVEEALKGLEGYQPPATPHVPQDLDNKVVGSGLISKNANGNFLFFDVPYQNRIIECIERPMAYVDGGNTKTQAQHLEWLLDKKNNPGGFTLADNELEYQLCRMSFDLRSDSTCGTLANEYIAKIRELYENWCVSADHIQYETVLEAIITNKGSIVSNPKRVIIPEFEDNYFVLSNKRSEVQLNQINPMDDRLKIFLKTYLGVGFEQAGIIFSYCASRKGKSLRETRVWTSPDCSVNSKPSECVGGLGVDGDGGLGIGAYDYVGRHALVVAERAKKSF